jgi:hypothetical protein
LLFGMAAWNANKAGRTGYEAVPAPSGEDALDFIVAFSTLCLYLG